MQIRHFDRHAFAIKIAHGWKKWIGLPLAFLPFFRELVQHRILEWLNHWIDEGAVFLIPRIRHALLASAQHPWLSCFIMLGAYFFFIVVWAFVSVSTHDQKKLAIQKADAAADPLAAPSGSAVGAGLSDSVVLASESEIEIHIEVTHQSPGNDGLLWSVINRGDYTVTACRAVVTSARTFNTKKGDFRVESTGQGRAGQLTQIRPDYPSSKAWLLRANRETHQLEIGNPSTGALEWPPADPVQTQKWLLTMRLETDWTLPNGIRQSSNWEFRIRLDWTPPDILKVGEA